MTDNNPALDPNTDSSLTAPSDLSPVDQSPSDESTSPETADTGIYVAQI